MSLANIAVPSIVVADGVTINAGNLNGVSATGVAVQKIVLNEATSTNYTTDAPKFFNVTGEAYNNTTIPAGSYEWNSTVDGFMRQATV